MLWEVTVSYRNARIAEIDYIFMFKNFECDSFSVYVNPISRIILGPAINQMKLLVDLTDNSMNGADIGWCIRNIDYSCRL